MKQFWVLTYQKVQQRRSIIFITTHTFLDLPRELRDEVYLHYVHVEGGLHFDFETGLLRTVDGAPINLSLMYTCRQIVFDMKGLALSANTVNFSTVLVESCDTRARAAHFDSFMEGLAMVRCDILDYCRHPISPTRTSDLLQRFPSSAPLLCHPTTVVYDDLPPSLLRAFNELALDLLYMNERFNKASKKAFNSELWENSTSAEVLSLRPLPWNIPTIDELNELEAICNPNSPRNPDLGLCLEYYFSAAAAAIHFLSNLQSDIRTQIRCIVLNENNRSAVFPESHALGLIPFCEENPLVRVQRLADLWRAVFPDHGKRLIVPLFLIGSYQQPQKGLEPAQMSSTLATWIDEAVALQAAGMPAESFWLIFEAHPSDLQIAFDILKEDAGWQEALEACYDRGFVQRPLENAYPNELAHRCHISDSFPRNMRAIFTGNSWSYIQMDVVKGDLWDIEPLVQRGRDWSIQKWEEEKNSADPGLLGIQVFRHWRIYIKATFTYVLLT
ncbi:hypothetical protein K458DRAFT_471229 [Lentithecium fluviatile CBS 122367]|uniref:Uncharacterized protein n=1 Tax=Lentithecium fluviatile CBS 122367 TaxID=1168545 RepID=A0A6G1ICA8_9PLEO|nr:hypothetical protein K458DRAFT_471229 [Lentithecium fluviatile CBS 122367]